MTSDLRVGQQWGVLAWVIGMAAVVGCAIAMAVWLAGAVHGLVLTHGTGTVLLAAAGGFVGVAIITVFGTMLGDLLRR